MEQLQESVAKIKLDREMGLRFMRLEDIRKEEFNAGKQEGIAEGRTAGRTEAVRENILQVLEYIGTVTDHLRTKISSIDHMEILENLFKKALEAENTEMFECIFDEIILSNRQISQKENREIRI